jgi:hypothetical protein
MAAACRDEILRPAQLADASGQKDANARKSAQTLCEYGVLKRLDLGGDYGFRLVEEWRGPLDEAELRASKGRLVSGQAMLLVTRVGAEALYRLLADTDEPDPRIGWVTRLPQHPRFALMLFLNPHLDEAQVERLTIELEQAGIEHERLVPGEIAGYPELREFAAASLPGAFGPGR